MLFDVENDDQISPWKASNHLILPRLAGFQSCAVGDDILETCAADGWWMLASPGLIRIWKVFSIQFYLPASLQSTVYLELLGPKLPVANLHVAPDVLWHLAIGQPYPTPWTVLPTSGVTSCCQRWLEIVTTEMFRTLNPEQKYNKHVVMHVIVFILDLHNCSSKLNCRNLEPLRLHYMNW